MNDARVARWAGGSAPTEDQLVGRLAAAGLEARRWGNGPGDRYGWHDHPYTKILYCVKGSITFHTSGGDLRLGPGDRLDIPPHTNHAATVGPDGVWCVEAPAWE